MTQATFLCDNQHVTLYYRQLEHLEDKLMALPEDATEEEREQIRALHSPESEYAKMKIRDLKQRLIKKGISVKYFRTVEELGQMVLEDWAEIIDMILPPLLCDASLLGKFLCYILNWLFFFYLFFISSYLALKRLLQIFAINI